MCPSLQVMPLQEEFTLGEVQKQRIGKPQTLAGLMQIKRFSLWNWQVRIEGTHRFSTYHHKSLFQSSKNLAAACLASSLCSEKRSRRALS